MTPRNLRVIRTGLALLMLSVVDGHTPGQSVAHASENLSETERGQLEVQFRSELSQFLYPEQFVLSVIERTDTGGTAGSQEQDILPGLGRAAADTSYDVLLVLDASVSESKAGLARGIIERLGGNKVTVQVASAPVLKVMPPQMLEESRLKNSIYSQPQPGSQRESQENLRQDPERRFEGDPFANQAPGQSPSAPQPSLFQLVQESPNFALKSLAVLWAAGASLVGLIFLLRKLVERNAASAVPPSHAAPSFAPQSLVPPSLGNPWAGRPSEITRDSELGAARDGGAALSKSNGSLGFEAHRPAPERVAKVLTNWIAESESSLDLARRYFRSLNLQEVETISALMHPGDVERLHGAPLAAADHTDEETEQLQLNSRMRLELSKLSARRSQTESDGPLDFLNELDERLLARLLEPENDHDIAAVCTQLAAHRLKFLLVQLPEERLASILASIQGIGQLKAEDLNPLVQRLQSRRDMFEAALVRPEELLSSSVHVLEVIQDLGKRMRVAARYFSASKSEHVAELHSKVLLLSDIAFLSKSGLRSLAQVIDVQIFAQCFSSDHELGRRVAQSLPAAYGEMFLAEMSLESVSSGTISPKALAESCRLLSQRFTALVEQAVIDGSEVDAAKRRSRAHLASIEEGRTADSDPGDDQGSDASIEGAA